MGERGYSFAYSATDIDGEGMVDVFTLNADPLNPGTSGQRYFFIYETNVIQFSTSAPPTASDPPIT